MELTEHRAEIAVLLAKPAGFRDGPVGDAVEDWRAWMRLVVRRRHGRGQDLQTALRLAWGEAEVVWHLRHGTRPDPRRCAGCGAWLEGAGGAMTMIDRAVVHIGGTHGLDCLVLYGEAWRGAACTGLIALGIKAPRVGEATP
jgi:hypothetical protein